MKLLLFFFALANLVWAIVGFMVATQTESITQIACIFVAIINAVMAFLLFNLMRQ